MFGRRLSRGYRRCMASSRLRWWHRSDISGHRRDEAAPSELLQRVCHVLAEVLGGRVVFVSQQLDHRLGVARFGQQRPDRRRLRARRLVRLVRRLGQAAAARYGAPYWIVHRADLQGALAAGDRFFEAAYLSDDAQEGPRAFREKREPTFEGR